MKQSVVISRYVLTAICALAVILAIALLISLMKGPVEKVPKSVVEAASAWIQDGGTVPLGPDNPDDPNDLQSYLSKEGVHSVLLFKGDGRFRFVDRSGKEIPICGEIVEGKITGCGVEGYKVELTTFTDFTLIGTKGSDGCTSGIHMGKMARVHANPAAAGHSYPCGPISSPPHPH